MENVTRSVLQDLGKSREVNSLDELYQWPLFNFKAMEMPLRTRDGSPVKGYKTLVREDAKQQVLAIVRDSYNVIQHMDQLERIRPLIERGLITPVQAGVRFHPIVKSWSRPWVSFQFTNNRFRSYHLIMMIGYNTDIALTFMGFVIELICLNGMQARKRCEDLSFKVRHTRRAEEEVKHLTSHIRRSGEFFAEAEMLFHTMQKEYFTREDAELLVKGLILPPTKNEDDEWIVSTRNRNMRDQLMRVYDQTLLADPQHKGTKFHALMAITQFYDHVRTTSNRVWPNKEISHAESTMFGETARKKSLALDSLENWREAKERAKEAAFVA